MAAENVTIRKAYIAGLQNVAKKILELRNLADDLSAQYQGASLAGTFVDGDFTGDVTCQHLVPADIATMTGQINTVSASITTNIRQSMSKAVGKPNA